LSRDLSSMNAALLFELCLSHYISEHSLTCDPLQAVCNPSFVWGLGSLEIFVCVRTWIPEISCVYEGLGPWKSLCVWGFNHRFLMWCLCGPFSLVARKSIHLLARDLTYMVDLWTWLFWAYIQWLFISCASHELLHCSKVRHLEVSSFMMQFYVFLV
jgi:hypothetical protein